MQVCDRDGIVSKRTPSRIPAGAELYKLSLNEKCWLISLMALRKACKHCAKAANLMCDLFCVSGYIFVKSRSVRFGQRQQQQMTDNILFSDFPVSCLIFASYLSSQKFKSIAPNPLSEIVLSYYINGQNIVLCLSLPVS